MTKSDQYYFTDSIFQLELNLHKIRRELILLVEEFEKEDCVICLQLKCRCFGTSPKNRSSFISNQSHESGSKGKDRLSKAPTADSLPKPKFKKEVVESLLVSKEKNNIEAWIEASRSVQKVKSDRRLPTDMLLASLKKSWGESRNDLKKEKILDDLKKERFILDSGLTAVNAVEVFFNNFKVHPAVTTASMSYVNNMAAVYGNHKSKCAEYSYF